MKTVSDGSILALTWIDLIIRQGSRGLVISLYYNEDLQKHPNIQVSGLYNQNNAMYVL